ncbi:hypothetical protein JCM3774_004435 [Rhodotorula dairenensis]
MSMKKAIDGATKPKRAAPKAKYIDPIVQATFQQDGQIREIVQCLSAKLRDPSQTVVFKSLIVLHTIMRSGQLDAVFSYLATSSTSLSLSSPEAANVAAYGQYLACRIKAYGNLKRDVVRDKSDRRAANRLKTLTVDQGLLRETREIQRMIAALVEAKFYTEDVDDDVSMTALRLLVKDLLVLFTAVNEGVINVLEHYFEMSHVDATLALKIYKTFCRDTEKVVAYLGTAKRLYNVLNIPIPNLRHAPLSLAKSLEEYLNDPNFEQNRQEYKENKRIADGGRPRSTTPKPSSGAEPAAKSSLGSASAASPSSQAQPATTSAAAAAPKSFTDFFESIEQQQTSMFNSPPQQQHTGVFPGSPFAVSGGGFMGAQPTGIPHPFGVQPGLMPQMTGNPFMQPQMTGFGMQPQVTGFAMQPQMTGMPNPFRQSTMMMNTGVAPNPFGMPPSQQTGMASATSSMPPPVPQVQPNMTGAHGPFGQSSPFGYHHQQQQQQQHLAPQQTGNPFGPQRAMSMMAQPTGNPFQNRPTSTAPPASGSNATLGASRAHSGYSSAASPTGATPSSGPARSNTMPALAPLTQQKTGMRNPFAPAPGTLIPQSDPQPAATPPAPSLNELATNSFAARLAQQPTGAVGGGNQPQWTTFGQSGGNAQHAPQQQGQPGSTNAAGPPKKQDAFSAFVAQQREKEAAAANGAATGPLISQKTGGLFADIASDLARSGNTASSSTPTATANSSASATTSPTSLSGPFSSLSFSSSNGGNSTTPATPATTTPYLSAQSTGFAGSNVRPFQPTSSFGSKLASEMSPAASSPISAQPTGAFGGGNPAGGGGGGNLNGGSSFAAGGGSSLSSAPPTQTPLQAQSTGFNPFGGTKLPALNTPLSAGITAQPTGYSGVATGSLI